MKLRSILVLLISVALLAKVTSAHATGDCEDYIDLTGSDLPISVSGTTEGASNDFHPFDPFSEPPGCWDGTWTWACTMGPDMTYKWSVPADGWYAISLVGSLYAADVQLFNFTCPDQPVYPDDFICGAHSVLQGDGLVTDLWLEAGREILIVVDGYAQGAGQYDLKIHDTNQLNDYLPFLMDAFHLPGLSTAVILDGGLYWTGEFGMASLEEENPSAVADSTLFLTMSSCKPITGTALMQAWEDGLFDLDDDVSDYLPFDLYHPDFPETPITFRMVMCHVASIPDHGLGSHIGSGEDSPLSLADYIHAYLAPDGIYYDPDDSFTNNVPGTRYSYSSTGIALVGYLTECIVPAPTFIDHCREQLFDPLGMDRSSFLLSDIIDVQHLALPYLWVPNSFVVPSDGHPHVPWYPGGCLRTSAQEMAHFLMAIMNGGELDGERIVAAATVDSMLTVQFPDVIPEGEDTGLVWRRIDNDGRVLWGHRGQWGRACSGVFFSLDENNGSVMLANSGGKYDGDVTPATHFVTDALLDFAARVEPVAVPDEADGPPQLMSLNPCYPNPFNPLTTIAFSLERNDHAEVAIYDLLGRRVTVLAIGPFAAGEHSLVWNGKDGRGRGVPSGTYIVRLETESGVEARKVMLVR